MNTENLPLTKKWLYLAGNNTCHASTQSAPGQVFAFYTFSNPTITHFPQKESHFPLFLKNIGYQYVTRLKSGFQPLPSLSQFVTTMSYSLIFLIAKN